MKLLTAYTSQVRRPGRWAPWIFAASLVFALVAVLAGGDGESPIVRALAVVVSATIFAQVVEAVRTGHLFQMFPSGRPPRVTRRSYPAIFWVCTLLYALLGLVFLALGVVVLSTPPISAVGETLWK